MPIEAVKPAATVNVEYVLVSNQGVNESLKSLDDARDVAHATGRCSYTYPRVTDNRYSLTVSNQPRVLHDLDTIRKFLHDIVSFLSVIVFVFLPYKHRPTSTPTWGLVRHYPPPRRENEAYRGVKVLCSSKLIDPLTGNNPRWLIDQGIELVSTRICFLDRNRRSVNDLLRELHPLFILGLLL